MGKNTKIEWTATIRADGTVVPGHTFNPWWGCVRISEGCENCYAESLSKRVGQNIWGPAKTTDRRLFGDKHWREPLKWDAGAKAAGQRHRVFCASMADVFEDHPQVASERQKLFLLIEQTPNLDWLLLTKRPQNILAMLPDRWLPLPDNVWIGTSVEHQAAADERIPLLLKVPAKVRFLSCEPLLGPVDLGWYLYPQFAADDPRHYPWRDGIEWVIAGGESGHGARPMHPEWARSLRDQCQHSGTTAFFHKQWGDWLPVASPRASYNGQRLLVDLAGNARPATWYDAMTSAGDEWAFEKVGKKEAGRLLDGRTWDEFPL